MQQYKFGFQTYTWQMSYDKYKDNIEHILDVIEKTGVKGLELETCMLGKFMDDAPMFKDALDRRGIPLGALTLVLDWKNANETDEEYAFAQKVLAYLKTFPGTKLCLVQMPRGERENLVERQNNCIACFNEVAKRAADLGIESTVHPNSPPSSLWRTADDYDKLMNGLDASVVGYTPDSGHIANGDMDPLSIITQYRSLVNHVHFKDFNGTWQAMGEGDIDHPAIVKYLKETDYAGWIMVEEESKNAETDPDGVSAKNGEYMKNTLMTI